MIIDKLQKKISQDFITAIVDGIMAIATLVMMLIYSVQLTLIVLGFFAVYLILRMITYPLLYRQNEKLLVNKAYENSSFLEMIRAILPLKVFAKENTKRGLWNNLLIDRTNSQIKLSKTQLYLQTSYDFLFGLEHVVIILLGAISVMNQSFSIGMLLAYFAYRQHFTVKIKGMLDKFLEYRLIKLHINRIEDISATEVEQEGGRVLSDQLKGEINVQELSYRYSQNLPVIFEKINFSIRPGECVVIVGPSGCGKTTLLKVMMGLLPAASGEVLIDQQKLGQFQMQALRRQMAAVMQDDQLLTGSIAENISFFDDHVEISRIEHAAKLAVIDKEILSMPMGYQSLVGDMGAALSGGQKQRVLLARALYAKPQILFLDEATSHLDIETEQKLNANIKALGMTRVMIAHRPETVSMAERVIDLGSLT